VPLTADLDHAATAPLRPAARAAMEPFLGDRYGNPSGSHALARDAVRAVDEARERTAEVLGCRPDEVVFTSGGTEADNHAVTGGLPVRAGVPVCSAVEHHAVLEPVRALGGRTVGVDRVGRVDLDALAVLLHELAAPGGPGVGVVSVMAANNEVGTVQDLAPVAAVVAEHAPTATLHTDAVQAAPWLELRTVAAPADLVSVSAHKLGGPKGAGALVVRRGTPIRPLLRGGGQEQGRRAGTTDVAGVVGFAAALGATAAEREAACVAVAARRDRLADGLLAAVPGLVETTVPDGDRSHLLPGTCHVLVDGVPSEPLLFLLDRDGVRASAASSCSSGAQRPSHVLDALGLVRTRDRGALRLTLGPDTTDAEVDLALRVVPAAVEHLRGAAAARPPAAAGTR
jgi:cysteine desulfurase